MKPHARSREVPAAAPSPGTSVAPELQKLEERDPPPPGPGGRPQCGLTRGGGQRRGSLGLPAEEEATRTLIPG